MMRAVALAARLDFALDPPVVDAIRRHRHEIAHSSFARLLEEYYKILRSGAAEKTFRGLAETGLLEPVSAELHRGADASLWHALGAIDAYRRRFQSAPETMSNAILLGTLLVPLDLSPMAGRVFSARTDDSSRATGPRLGDLPLARRDVERLRQVLGLQRRLRDTSANMRAQQALVHRGAFRDALTWLEIHGGAPEIVDQWAAVAETRAAGQTLADVGSDEPAPTFRRRRRRRRRYRPTPER